MSSEYNIGEETTDGYKDISYSYKAGGGFYGNTLSKWNKSKRAYEDISSNTINNDAGIDESGRVYDENDMEIWNTYTNFRYKFDIKYPFTWSNWSTDSGNFTKPQPYKIAFEDFTIRVWDNSDYPKPEQFFASESFCALNKSLCESYYGKSEAPLKNMKIGDNAWIKISNNTQRSFIQSPDDHYIIELEVNKADDKDRFNQMLSTFKFMEK